VIVPAAVGVTVKLAVPTVTVMPLVVPVIVTGPAKALEAPTLIALTLLHDTIPVDKVVADIVHRELSALT
jgi:hypothetical protein